MIEEELTLKEPKSLMKWLWRFWAAVGIYQVWKYTHSIAFQRLKEPKPGVDYRNFKWV